MTFRARIMLLGLMGAAAAILVGIVSLSVQFRVQSTIEHNTTLGLATRNHVEMDMMHDAIHTDVLAALLAVAENTPDQLPGITKELDEHVLWFNRLLDANLELPLAKKEKAAIADVKPALDVYASAAQTLVQEASSNPAMARAALSSFENIFEDLEVRNEKVSNLLTSSMKSSAAELSIWTQRSKIIIVFVLLLVMIVVVIMARRISTQMSTLLGGEPEETIELINRMAAGGLSTHIDTSHADPHSMLAAISDMRKNLMRMLQETSVSLAAVAPELTASATQTREDMRKQSEETHTIVTATTQLAVASEEVAQNATIISSSAQDARTYASQGKLAVDDAIRANMELSTHMNNAVAVVGKLNTGSQQITTFVEVIRTIAEQTNLLALNAAIEAARAGDQGRGFAVVADEVRTLAQRTQGATQEIEQIISSLAQTALEATDSIRKGESLAGDSVSRTTELGNVLETINKSIAIVDEGNTQIATAAEEQSAVTRNINNNIERIADVARKASDAAERTMNAVRSVNNAMDQLAKMVNQRAS